MLDAQTQASLHNLSTRLSTPLELPPSKHARSRTHETCIIPPACPPVEETVEQEHQGAEAAAQQRGGARPQDDGYETEEDEKDDGYGRGEGRDSEDDKDGPVFTEKWHEKNRGRIISPRFDITSRFRDQFLVIITSESV